MSVSDYSAIEGRFDRAAERYAELTVLRAGVALVPYVGGALDTFLAGRGSRIQLERFERLIADLRVEVDALKDRTWPDLSEPPEELFDLFVVVAEGSARTRSRDQRKRFARVLARGAVDEQWSEAEEAARLLDVLHGLHITVLRVASEAPPSPENLGGKKLISLVDPDREGAHAYAKELPYVPALIPAASKMLIVKVCSDLVARGLLTDEGAGRYNGSNMDLFTIAEFGGWFLRWVEGDGNS